MRSQRHPSPDLLEEINVHAYYRHGRQGLERVRAHTRSAAFAHSVAAVASGKSAGNYARSLARQGRQFTRDVKTELSKPEPPPITRAQAAAMTRNAAAVTRARAQTARARMPPKAHVADDLRWHLAWAVAETYARGREIRKAIQNVAPAAATAVDLVHSDIKRTAKLSRKDRFRARARRANEFATALADLLPWEEPPPPAVVARRRSRLTPYQRDVLHAQQRRRLFAPMAPDRPEDRSRMKTTGAERELHKAEQRLRAVAAELERIRSMKPGETLKVQNEPTFAYFFDGKRINKDRFDALLSSTNQPKKEKRLLDDGVDYVSRGEAMERLRPKIRAAQRDYRKAKARAARLAESGREGSIPGMLFAEYAWAEDFSADELDEYLQSEDFLEAFTFSRSSYKSSYRPARVARPKVWHPKSNPARRAGRFGGVAAFHGTSTQQHRVIRRIRQKYGSVRRFQKRAGVVVDGVVGRQTTRAFRRSK